MNASLSAIASWPPIGRPHCSRAPDHSRATFRHHLPPAAHRAGNESRPALSVVSAILSPCPSRPTTFSAGTRTSWKRVTLFSRSEEHTSELQSRRDLVCRLLLEKK